MRLRQYSIKQRLLVSTVILAAGLLSIMMLKVYQANQVASLSSSQLLVEQLKTEVLMLRRHEKDFMLRARLDYLERFRSSMEDLRRHTRELREGLVRHQINTTLVDTFAQNIETYEDNFARYVETGQVSGLSQDSGLQGSLRNVVNQLEASLQQEQDDHLLVQLLNLRRHEKDFMLRADTRYVDRFNQVAQPFSGEVSGTLAQELARYVQSFNDYVAGQQAMGLDENSGVTGDMRRAVHATGKDELTRVSEDFNRMMVRFQELVGGLHEASETLAASSHQLSAVSEEVSTIAQNQEQQTTMIATAITEMSAAIQEVAQNAHTAASSAESADDEAKAG